MESRRPHDPPTTHQLQNLGVVTLNPLRIVLQTVVMSRYQIYGLHESPRQLQTSLSCLVLIKFSNYVTHIQGLQPHTTLQCMHKHQAI